MPFVAFTFGSLGDIISLIKIANAVRNSLCDTKGSFAEYQDLILEVDSVVFTVTSVQHELSVRGPNRISQSVENGLLHAIHTCLRLLEHVDENIRALKKSTQTTSWAGMSATDMWRRIGWGLFRKEELVALRQRLSGQVEAMNTLLVLAQGERLDRFGRRQDELVLEIRRCVSDMLSVNKLDISSGNLDPSRMDKRTRELDSAVKSLDNDYGLLQDSDYDISFRRSSILRNRPVNQKQATTHRNSMPKATDLSYSIKAPTENGWTEGSQVIHVLLHVDFLSHLVMVNFSFLSLLQGTSKGQASK